MQDSGQRSARLAGKVVPSPLSELAANKHDQVEFSSGLGMSEQQTWQHNQAMFGNQMYRDGMNISGELAGSMTRCALDSKAPMLLCVGTEEQQGMMVAACL